MLIMGLFEVLIANMMLICGTNNKNQQNIGRVKCPCPKQGQNPNSQFSSAIFAQFYQQNLKIMTKLFTGFL